MLTWLSISCSSGAVRFLVPREGQERRALRDAEDNSTIFDSGPFCASVAQCSLLVQCCRDLMHLHAADGNDCTSCIWRRLVELREQIPRRLGVTDECCSKRRDPGALFGKSKVKIHELMSRKCDVQATTGTQRVKGQPEVSRARGTARQGYHSCDHMLGSSFELGQWPSAESSVPVSQEMQDGLQEMEVTGYTVVAEMNEHVVVVSSLQGAQMTMDPRSCPREAVENCDDETAQRGCSSARCSSMRPAPSA